MTEKEVLTATDEWIKNLKNLLPSVSSENQEYVQSRIKLLERLREQVERVEELESEIENWQKGRFLAVSTIVKERDLKKRAQELEKENRRYRKIINDIIEKAILFGTNEEVYDAIQDALKAKEV